jgi:hypothetical protein
MEKPRIPRALKEQVLKLRQVHDYVDDDDDKTAIIARE